MQTQVPAPAQGYQKRIRESSTLATLPPQAREIEEAILGAIMLEKGAYERAAELLKPESFYVDAHQVIFEAMQRLNNTYSAIDMLTVVQMLQKMQKLDDVGGAYYITRLTNGVVSTANLEHHCRVVQECYLKREVIRVSNELQVLAYEAGQDVFALLDLAEGEIFKLQNETTVSDVKHISQVTAKCVEAVRHKIEHPGLMTGVPTGSRELDELTGGWQPTDLIILAARPSVGKTSFALNLARNAANDPHRPTPVAIFSLEMGDTQLVDRVLSAVSGIELKKLKRGQVVDIRQIEEAANELNAAPIYLDDTAGLTMSALRTKARRLKTKHGIGLIIVDYLQLMSSETKGGNREQEVSAISRRMKILAKELNVPVILLSQLSREVEKRANKTPQLSDLRESGAIEQDADVVVFLYRPDEEACKQDATLASSATVKFAKHRNGELKELMFDVDFSRQLWKSLGYMPENLTPISQLPKQPTGPYNERFHDDNPF